MARMQKLESQSSDQEQEQDSLEELMEAKKYYDQLFDIDLMRSKYWRVCSNKVVNKMNSFL